MKIFRIFFVGAALFLSIVSLSGFGESRTRQPWNLPAALDDRNAEVLFTVDTTWHTVHGVAKTVVGKAWLANPKDYRTVKLEVLLPVATFDTDSKSRDKNLRSSMEEERFPNVSFMLTDVGPICDPDGLEALASCSFKSLGNLTIRDVTKPVELEAMATRGEDSSFTIEGQGRLNWLEYGVKDPSILVARVDKSVVIRFKLFLAPQG